MRTMPDKSAKGEFVIKGTGVFHRRTGKYLGSCTKSPGGGFEAHPADGSPREIYLLRKQALSCLRGKAGLDVHDALYMLELLNAGDQKIKVIKLVRELTGLPLKEAKSIADLGGLVVDGLDLQQVNALVRRFDEAGATSIMVRMHE